MRNNTKRRTPATFINAKVTTTISITLVLFLLGLIVFLSLFIGNLSTYVKETLSFDVVLQENVPSERIQRLQTALKAMPFAKSVVYISKEQALKQLESDLGQDPENILGYNPLPDVISVYLTADYANSDSLSVIEKQLKTYSDDIAETEYRQDTMQFIVENIARTGLLLLVVAAILLFISFALINNTIRLMLYSKRFLIHTMQLVGAKKSFIMRPFIWTNLLIGAIAALFANALLYWLIRYFAGNIPDMYLWCNLQSLLVVGVSVLVLGLLITLIATYLAVGKYIRADIENLYKM
ncbi:MAG: permease-like cell division protein FtsX [Candidatus Symbiothrix sp.]|jgi:cell division transport system permease protein|nr:permease-like cell division protein FtsX [Candidatus Symbiothrix sp.]